MFGIEDEIVVKKSTPKISDENKPTDKVANNSDNSHNESLVIDIPQKPTQENIISFAATNNPLIGEISSVEGEAKSCCGGGLEVKPLEEEVQKEDSSPAGDGKNQEIVTENFGKIIYGKDVQFRGIDYAAIHLKAWFNMTKPVTAGLLKLFNPLKYIDIGVSKFALALQAIIPADKTNPPLRGDKYHVFDRLFNFINRRDMQRPVSGVNPRYEASWYAHYLNMHLLNVIISAAIYYAIGKHRGYSAFSIMMITSAIVGAVIQGNDGRREKDGTAIEPGCIKQEVLYQNQRFGSYVTGAINSVLFCYGMFKANHLINLVATKFVPLIVNHMAFKSISNTSVFLVFAALSARFMCPIEATFHGAFDYVTFSKTRTYLGEKYSTPATRRNSFVESVKETKSIVKNNNNAEGAEQIGSCCTK